MENPTVVIALLALLIFVGLALEELFRRTGIPDTLVLLGIGVAAGATGYLDVRQLHGLDLLFTTSALVLLLFEGAIQLRVSDLRSSLGRSLRLTLLGFFLTMLAVSAVAILLMGMRPLAGLLLGAILGGTSSSVVIPRLELERNTWTVLNIESSIGDVLCIVFSLALVGALAAGTVDYAGTGLQFALGVLGAVLLGVVAGLVWAFGLRPLRERSVSSVALAAAVFLVYAVAEGIGLYGAVACLSFGIVLGNAPSISARGVSSDDLAPAERLFLAEIAFVLKIFFFVLLGASLPLASWKPWVFGLLATAAIFAVRPLAVRLGLRSRYTPKRDALVASALVPQGLASAVLATVPLRAGVEEGGDIYAATVGAVLFTIAFSSVLVFAIDKPFVQKLYGGLFRSYPLQLGIPVAAATPVLEAHHPLESLPESEPEADADQDEPAQKQAV